MISVGVVSENNLWNKKIKKKDIFFNTLVKFFPKKYRFIGKKISLSILLSDNKRIKKLNKSFRNKDKPTDVLSFPFEKKLNLKKNTYLGDIVISYEFMNKQKNLTNHLLGHDHVKLKDFKKMSKEEEKIYKLVKSKNEKFA